MFSLLLRSLIFMAEGPQTYYFVIYGNVARPAWNTWRKNLESPL
jgi:hypothetical protein